VKLALQCWHNSIKPFQQTLLALVGRCWKIVGICWNIFQKLFKLKVCSANYMTSTTYEKRTLKLYQKYLYNIVGYCWTLVGICWNVFQKLFKFKVKLFILNFFFHIIEFWCPITLKSGPTNLLTYNRRKKNIPTTFGQFALIFEKEYLNIIHITRRCLIIYFMMCQVRNY